MKRKSSPVTPEQELSPAQEKAMLALDAQKPRWSERLLDYVTQIVLRGSKHDGKDNVWDKSGRMVRYGGELMVEKFKAAKEYIASHFQPCDFSDLVTQ
jgi:hypothetical protein